ncbi:MAG TPA: S-(hydroxymethyl)mycothiol dehydrogenase [Candidatus Dormibacteraeota bacterium]
MAHQVRGVVALGKGERVRVETVLVPDPGPGEVLVRPRACGVCHTDLHYREGAIGNEFPYLLGHEAAGVVQAVGADVTSVAAGDEVILAWRAPCGHCRSCLRGRPWYCFDSRNASQTMMLADGTPLSAAIGIGGFSELTLVAEGQCVPMPPGTDPEVGGLIGCGIMAGFGAAVNTGGVSRGDTVAVFGCGGVGNAAIAGAALAGARTVIAVDIDARKLEWAKVFGATHTVDASKQDPVEAVRGLTGGFGVDLAIEAVGNPTVFEQAFMARDHAGTVVLVGVPDPAMTLSLPMIEIFGRGGAIKPSWYGDALPTRDFPILVDLHRAGKLDLMAFVSERIGIDDVEGAFEKMQRGEVLRSVVMLPA